MKVRLSGLFSYAPLLVLLLVLLLSVPLSLVIAGFARAQQQSRFDRETQTITSDLKDRLNDYERLLHTARAAWLVHPDMLSEQTFNAFVENIDLARRYPGVQALGFGAWLPDGQTQALERRLRQAVKADYRVRPAATTQTGRAPIAVIAPLNAANDSALGFDLYSEGLRRSAMERARQSGQVQATERVELVQKDERGEPLRGFLLMLPVWRDADQQVLQGFLYVAVRADQFLADLGTPNQPGTLYMHTNLAGQALSTPTLPGNLAFQSRQAIQLDGQRWDLQFGANRQFGRDFAASVPLLTLLAGMAIAGLAFGLVQAQVNARTRAEALNLSLSQTRARQEQARAEFEAIFQSMQDAAAFTDESGRIRLVNRAFSEQFHWRPNEIVGEPLAKLHLDQRLEGHAAFQALTTPYRRADSSTFSGEAQRGEVLDAAGQRLGLLEVVRDVSERVAAERALQQAGERYRGVLDAIQQILQVSDPQGQVTFLNEQHRALLGEQTLLASVLPQDRATFERLQREARESQQGAAGELQLNLCAGQTRWFLVRIMPIRDRQGGVGEWVTSATDIHDRLLAERLAQRNEQRYRGVLEGLPQIVWLTDPHGQPIYFNQRWDEYVGAERASYGFLGLIHPDDREAYRTRWLAAVKAVRPFEAEHRLLGSDGVYRTFVTRGLPVRDPQGQVLEWVGTSTDVDDSVYAENAARLLADVSDHLAAPTSDLLRGRQGHYRTALLKVTARFVDSAAIWTAYPLRVLATSSLHSAWDDPQVRQEVDRAVTRVLASQDPLFLRSHPLLHRVSVSGALLYPLLSQGGQTIGVLGLAYRHPLTDRDQDLAQELAKRVAVALDNDALQQQVATTQADLQVLNQSLEERVQRRTLELQGANRELEAFSYSVSHDLRTPLRHIVGFGDLLAKEAGEGLSSKGQRYLGIITSSAKSMSQLIDDLLAFSRMGRQELRRGPVNLEELLHASWRGLEHDRQGRAVQFSVQGDLPTVQGDASMLGLVFTNLLSNAIKYTRTREQARIEVRGERRGQDVTVSVRDNGVGFDPKYADKLFGVFQRLHRDDEFEGIGIGLANVRRIVNRHGGQVQAEAQPDLGAVFSVTLPLHGSA